MPDRCLHTRRIATLAAVLVAPLLVWALLPVASQGQSSEGALQDKVARQKAREHSLSGAAARLARLEQLAARDVQVLQGRLADAQAQLDTSRARLAQTEVELRATRRHLARLRVRVQRDRAVLADVLRQAYVTGRPDLISVVLGSDGFADLVDRAEFYRRVQQRNAQVVGAVREARNQTHHDSTVLAALVPRRRAATEAVQRERDGLAQMSSALEARRAALESARQARLAALSTAVASRRSAEHELRRLEAQRAAAVNQTGPGGPWSIPWPIVQCESGGQNLPPNYAGASGYYQFMRATWHNLGGSTPNAYQASKAEQDRLAAQLWNGGAGAGNWVCAALVGLT